MKKSGLSVIYEYCKDTLKNSPSIEHLQACEDAVYRIEHGRLPNNGCPSSLGLPDFEGDCGADDSRYTCKECWERASKLNITETPLDGGVGMGMYSGEFLDAKVFDDCAQVYKEFVYKFFRKG